MAQQRDENGRFVKGSGSSSGGGAPSGGASSSNGIKGPKSNTSKSVSGRSGGKGGKGLTAGMSIVDAGWMAIRKRVIEIAARDRYVKVGVIGDEELATIAAVHEYGSPQNNIPERSFIRRTFSEKEAAHRAFLARVVTQILRGTLTVDRGLGMIGAWGAAEVKKTITAGPHIPPPLSPRTIARKGSDRPLVDTGQLVGAITWEVF